MSKILYGFIAMLLLLAPVTKANAGISIGFGFPNVSIGINLPMLPELTPVPGYPVYYAPEVDGNYFFYDGMYWVYQDDNWYTSSWYNGPWAFVEPNVVPLFILRIPVRYYRQPPVYFRGWHANAAPRWGQHWGRDWEQHRRGWDRWNKRSVPARAPRPTYQRQYSGERYPAHTDEQHKLRSQSYRYQPRDKRIRQHLQQQRDQRVSPAVVVPVERRREQSIDERRTPMQLAPQNAAPHQHSAPADLRRQEPQRGVGHVQNPVTVPLRPNQMPRAADQREQKQHTPDLQEERSQGRGERRDSNRSERGEGRDRDEDRGRGR